MTYTIRFTDSHAFAYDSEGEQCAKFDIEQFLMCVISPKEFRSFERNPDKRKFEIRKLELNMYNLGIRTPQKQTL